MGEEVLGRDSLAAPGLSADQDALRPPPFEKALEGAAGSVVDVRSVGRQASQHPVAAIVSLDALERIDDSQDVSPHGRVDLVVGVSQG